MGNRPKWPWFLEDFRTLKRGRGGSVAHTGCRFSRGSIACDLASEDHFSNGPSSLASRGDGGGGVKTCLTTLLCAMGPLCCRTKRTDGRTDGRTDEALCLWRPRRTRLERILSFSPRPPARSLSRSGTPVARQCSVLIRAAQSANSGEFSVYGVHRAKQF